MKEKTINFPMVFHFHQPVGNFPWVYEDCYKKAYGPLIKHIYKYPDLKVTLHFSGNLLEWFIEHKPKMIEKVKEMAARNQIEIIGGGYYEPIYAIIPYRDKIAQLNKLTELIEKEFNLKVKGAWLSERVWEPNYPSFLSDAGLEYVIVDDNHFRSTGMTEEEALYSYVTEDEGKTTRIFPIDEQIRYLTPWKPSTKIIEYLRGIVDEKGDRIALFISDAEKMGVWGSTHTICYVDGKGHQEGDNGKPYIPTLFTRLLEHKWIKSLTLAEYMDQYPAKNLVYLPTASYDKMEEWVLPSKIRKKFSVLRKELKDNPEKKDLYLFLKGGFWRYYLVKYPESNNMHKKMLYVREKLLKVEEKVKNLDDNGKTSELQEKIDHAWEEIYKSQCNDCYWHGMFGGIYLQFLRFEIYSHLINAEKIIDEINQSLYSQLDKYISVIPIDFNKDSREDILIESDLLNLYINANDGGTLFELDYKPKSYNLLNTLTRWREAYHEKDKLKDADIKNDNHRRSMLRIRIFSEITPLRKLFEDDYQEYGDFIDGEFSVVRNEKDDYRASLELEREGIITISSDQPSISCNISKEIIVKENAIELNLTGNLNDIKGGLKKEIIDKLKIAVDFPFFFNGNQKNFTWDSPDLDLTEEKKKDLLGTFEYKGSKFHAKDGDYDLKFQIQNKSEIEESTFIKFPIIAYAYTDEGYKEIYQGINVLTCFNLKKSFSLNFQLKIN